MSGLVVMLQMLLTGIATDLNNGRSAVIAFAGNLHKLAISTLFGSRHITGTG